MCYRLESLAPRTDLVEVLQTKHRTDIAQYLFESHVVWSGRGVTAQHHREEERDSRILAGGRVCNIVRCLSRSVWDAPCAHVDEVSPCTEPCCRRPRLQDRGGESNRALPGGIRSRDTQRCPHTLLDARGHWSISQRQGAASSVLTMRYHRGRGGLVP